MSVPVTADQIAVGDYSEVYGTVTKVVHNVKDYVLVSLDIYFFNGESQSGVDPDATFDMVQGWNNGHPEGSVRPELAADHADE